MQKTLAVLILAAGAASRMGRPKQLLPWKNTTLLGHTIGIAKQFSDTVLVVLGAHAEKVQKSVPDGIDHIVNTKWASGMGTSIALGVEELEKRTAPDAILILLIDQPLIDMDHLKKMFAKAESGIVATAYGEKPGVPILFSRGYFDDLMALDADHGARYFLKRYQDDLAMVDAPGKTIDLDTLAQYGKWYADYGS